MNALMNAAFCFSCFFGLVSTSALFDHFGGIGIARWKFYAFPAFAVSMVVWVAAFIRHRGQAK